MSSQTRIGRGPKLSEKGVYGPFSPIWEWLQPTWGPSQPTWKWLQTTWQPLQTTRKSLQTTRERLQTTWQPLQTARKSLQTTREWLQTTRKWLQTTRKWLQTTWQPLQTTRKSLQTTWELLQPSLRWSQNASFLRKSVIASPRSGGRGDPADFSEGGRERTLRSPETGNLDLAGFDHESAAQRRSRRGRPAFAKPTAGRKGPALHRTSALVGALD
jgi:hypothetical protein